MKIKLLAIFVMMLIITTVLPATGLLKKSIIGKNCISDSGWIEVDKVIAINGKTNDQYGDSVSIDDNYAIVGPVMVWGDDSACIYRRDGINWIAETKLHPSPPGDIEDCAFGSSVSISGDYAIVGAPRQNFTHQESGVVYVFKREGNSWIEKTKLTPMNYSEKRGYFGWSVCIKDNKLIIGVPYDNTNGRYFGSAYVFKYDGNSWIEEARLLPSDPDSLFGWSVSIDDDYAIIGASHDDENEDNSGAAYIFKFDGNNWVKETKLIPSDGGELDYFGCSVSINGDYAIIGAELHDQYNSGAAYIFKNDGNSWVENKKINPSENPHGAGLGCSVSIDGNYVFIGAYLDDDAYGAVYIYELVGSSWIKREKIFASDAAQENGFGKAVYIKGDQAIIGAPGNNNINGLIAGAAYIFKKYAQSQGDFIIDGLSPIDLKVTDSEGHYIDKSFSNIPDASYIEEDLNGDEEPDDRVIIPEAIDGLYTIEVIPEPETEPTDTYSLKVTFKDVSYYLAEDVMIMNIPSNGYSLSWPDKPTKPSGPSDGVAGESYNYTSSTIDPDGDEIFYLFDWGDGTDSGWVETGESSHSWSEKGNYDVKVRAKDINGFESAWSDPFSVKMPRSKTIFNHLLQSLFSRFTNLFPIFQRFLNRLG